MKLHSLRQRPLALALHLAAAISAPAVHAEQLIAAGTTPASAEVDGKTFDTGVASDINGIAILAVSNGHVSGSNVIARSGGEGVASVMAVEDGSTIDLRNSEITASGASSVAALAADGGALTLIDSKVNATNADAVSVGALDGSVSIEGGSVRSAQGTAILGMGADALVSVQGSTISGSGDGRAVVASVDGARVVLAGGSIESNGSNNASVLQATGEGSRIEASDVAIEAHGSGTTEEANAVALALSGGQVTLQGGTVHTYGSNAVGVWSEGAGSRVVASGNTITTAGPSAIAVLARDEGAVAIEKATISTTGLDAHGIQALQGGTVAANGTSVSTSASSAHGLYAEQSSTIHFDGGSVATQADHAAGVVSLDSSIVTLQGTKVSTEGVLADAIDVGGKATVNATDVSLATRNDEAYGVYAHDGGSAVLNNVSISTHGARADGVGSLNPDSNVAITGGSVTTEGEAARGLGAYLSGTVSANDLAVTTRGSQAAAASAHGSGSRIDVDGSTLVTEGAQANGVIASTSGQVHVRASTVSTGGDGAYGLSAIGENSVVEADGVNVKVSGADTFGALAVSGGTVRISNGSRIENTGVTAQSHAAGAFIHDPNAPTATFEATDSALISANGLGVAVTSGASARLTNTSVEAKRHAVGYEAAQAKPDGSASISVDGGSLHSGEATVGVVSGKGTVTLANGVQITADNGVLAQVNPSASLTLNLNNVQVTGDLVAAPPATLDFNLAAGSALTGTATNAGNATIDATSLWTIDGNSVVASMRNGGSIAFTSPAGGGFKRLYVGGDYVGEGGRLVLNSALGGDLSATDKLVVHGNTTGSTAISVNNVGGAGALTSNGIQVVQVDGASDGTFALANRATAGAYEYLLYKGGKTNPTDGDWYLRSEAAPVVPVDPVTPVDPAPPVDPVVPIDPIAPADQTPVEPEAPQPSAPLYRPEPAAYLANQAAAVGMFEHSMHDRMGEANLGKRGDDGRTSAAWVRVVRNQIDGTTGEGQLDAGTDASVLQIGGEIARWNDDSRFHIGLMGGTGRANTEVASTLLDWRAKGKVIGYNLGVYGTWFANASDATGLYLDGWLQYGRYDNKVQGDYLAEERYDASTWAGSIEAGYAIALNEGGKSRFFIEPQAQAIFTDYSMSRHVENNGTRIDDVDAGGLTTRLGVRFYGHAASAQANIVQPFVTVNWWHDDDRNRMSFNTTTLELELPRDRYEAKLGLQGQLGGGWTGWGNLGLVYGAGDYRDVTGQLGLNYRW
ncbi:autotransporter outer membrane beta-barrel domain-containing protein [Lysobacter arvi]|uniref:Autotransporter outer membrane beta-barrel domain-containing protein n=1 Tax=Lysobacter arvi TaxID=3038776 RepID=A0ABU1CBX1_9GAMM|nr:autotransporter outer membrane beta-barrel domain-containing protein [Lysobacter arvi]MDR0182686.1 autotransporter outer membrane beta-barrel domain-containing protein [Lysobacter arvi]